MNTALLPMVNAIDLQGVRVPVVPAKLDFADMLGSWKARWEINRMNYEVNPGLYAVGQPNQTSPVFISANYKMSFDRLRSALKGINGWLLALDTKGINVWCAAGKGTFGTDELIRRIGESRLVDIVSHRTVIVPQLGATGVRAIEVKERSGFEVVFGPVRARDLHAFLDSGMKASPQMRSVRFDFPDRVVLIPIELVYWGKYILPLCAIFYFLGGMNYALPLLISLFTGAVLTPALLPWLPFRSFSAKGAFAGLAAALISIIALNNFSGLMLSSIGQLAWISVIVSLSSFIAMYFTGASTYTSLSGVRKELRFAIPSQATLALAGITLWIAGRFGL